jgi:hypothetical protein
MMAVAERFEALRAASLATNWRGRSGRFYALAPVPVASFSLSGTQLYLLAAHNRVLWVGTAAEVVGDASCRARFRTALSVADVAFEIAAPEGEIDRLTMAWDLEVAEPILGLSLA